jgi:hypothetical protein
VATTREDIARAIAVGKARKQGDEVEALLLRILARIEQAVAHGETSITVAVQFGGLLDEFENRAPSLGLKTERLLDRAVVEGYMDVKVTWAEPEGS